MKQSTLAEYRNWVIVNFFCNTECRRMILINICIEDLDNVYCKLKHTKNRKPNKGILIASNFSEGVEKVINRIDKLKDVNGNKYNFILRNWDDETVDYPK